MIVVIGCEESGTSRDLFIDAGHDTLSCDLEPGRGNHIKRHVQRDIIEFLTRYPNFSIDLTILHPDCTTVCVAGNRYWAGTSERQAQINWIVNLWRLAKLKSKRVALENPASVIWPYLRREGARVQFIQPYQFGHTEQKKTGLALHNLPELRETNNVYDEMIRLPISEREKIWYMSPGPNRKRDRSKTYSGIASAFVEQWGAL